MSQFSYNNISAQFVRTDLIDRTTNWSDDGTEYKWTDFIISITFLYNPAATSYVTGGIQNPGSLPPQTDVAIRHQLMQPRMPLLYQESGQTIVSIPALFNDGSTIDCNNGPFPQFCNVTRIASTRLFYVSYSVKCAIIECPSGAITSPIASSRYSRHESINDQYLSTLVTRGVTYFRSNVLDTIGGGSALAYADAYRAYIIPQQLLGYARREVSFALSSDGLKCEWSTTDVEQIQDLGNPSIAGTAGSLGIVKMDLVYRAGSMQKSSLGAASLGSICNVDVTAYGQKYSDRYGMMLFCLRVSWDKLVNILPMGYLTSCDLMEDVFNNIVSMSMSYTLLNQNPVINEVQLPITPIVGILVKSLPSLNGINPVLPFDNGTRGSQAYILAVNNLATACYTNITTISSDMTGLIISPTCSSNNPQYGEGCKVQAYWQQPIPVANPSFPPQTSIGTAYRGAIDTKTSYRKYEIKSNNVTSKGIIQLPEAAAPCSTNPNSQNYNPNCKPKSCVNIQAFQSMTRKVVEFAIERVGAVPEVPNPTIDPKSSYYGNYTLLSSIVTPVGIEQEADGYTTVYRVSGVYTYSLLTQLNDVDTIPFDIPSWVTVTPSSITQIQPVDFEYGIINNPPVTQ